MTERSIFQGALDVPDPTARAAYLDQTCAGDTELRRGVEALLAAHFKSGSFMPAPACEEGTRDYRSGEEPGSRVGPYKLLQRIGEGGMGAVYMAEQEQPVRRMVALKIIREGMDSRAVLARFEAERQALALMDHPNIAKVLDAGTTDAGRPYFVMELVKGVPITRYCDENQLILRERLELFVPVCQAIQHAHQKGIIHRDIKPSNVLVALYDDRPVPKVIDFGVAKATSQKLTDKTLFTAFGSVVGTLEYMSPEQARLNQLDVDTRSDVYALGVLLYELLTGTTPLDRTRLKTAALDEVLRLIREEEPERPSTRLSTAHSRPAVGTARRTEPTLLGKVVCGELDWIVMKALEKDRTRRYETANGLARDIQRYLHDEPVEACPPTIGYRLRKAYRKNRAAVGVVAAFLVLLATATGVSAVLAVQAHRAELLASAERDHAQASAAEANDQRERADWERRRAEQEKRSAQAVRDFLQNDLLLQAGLLQQAEVRRLTGGEFEIKQNPTVRELLDRAADQLAPDKINVKFPGLPEVQAEVLKTVGDSYLSIQQPAKAIEYLTRAVELLRSAKGTDDPATLDARQSLGLTYFLAGRKTEGITLLEGVRDDRVRVQGLDHPDTFTCRERLGMAYLDTKAAPVVVEYMEQMRNDALRFLGPHDFHTAYATHDLACAYLKAGRAKDAVRELETLQNIAIRFKMRRDHPYTLTAQRTLADAYRADGRRADAAKLMEEALPRWETLLGERHPVIWLIRHNLAWDYMTADRKPEAVTLFEKNLAIADTLVRERNTRAALHKALRDLGRFEDALAVIQKSYDLQVKQFGENHKSWETGKTRSQIGRVLLQLKRYDEAEPLLISGYQEMAAHVAQQPSYDSGELAAANRAVIDLYTTTKKPDKLTAWVGKDLEVREQDFRRLQSATGASTVDVLKAAGSLALLYVEAGRNEDAIKLFDETFARQRMTGWPFDQESITALNNLRLAVGKAGRYDLAATMAAEIIADFRRRPEVPREVLGGHLFGLGHYLSNDRRYSEAEAPLRESLAIRIELDPRHWTVTKSRLWLGTALLRQEKYTESEPMLLQTFKEAVERKSNAPSWERHFPATTAGRLAELYTALGKPQEAAKWEAERRRQSPTSPNPDPNQ